MHPAVDQPPSTVPRAPLFRAGLALATAGWLVLVWNALCTVPGVPWNPARLAPSFALAHGLPFYALRDSGAHLGWIYGPVFPLWYLPVTLTDNPTLALLFAGLINLATLLAPPALVLAAAGVARGPGLAAATLAAAVLQAGDHTLWASYYFVHVDAVCVALGVAGCVALHRAAQAGGRRWLHLAALGVVLAFWTKVLALPLFVVMPLWLWRERRELVGGLLFALLLWGGLVSLAVLAWFGPEEIFFNGWLFHARNPWVGGGKLLLHNVLEALSHAWVWIVLLLWLLCDRWLRPTGAVLPPRATSLIRLLLLAAFCQLSLGLLAPLKSGGTLGSLHSVEWALLATMVALWHRWTCPVPAAAVARPAAVFALAVLASLVLAAVSTARFGVGGVWTPYRGLEADLAQARANVGRIYFPWNPMLTIISERRVYPLDDALYGLATAGLAPPPEKIRAVVPAGALVVYHENAQSRFAARYFSGPPLPPATSSPHPSP
jgi:hypothetical protein